MYGDQTTSAESDIRQATQLARQMVGRFGMSEGIGFVAVLPQDGEASALQGLTEVSEHTRRRVDAEVKRMVGEARRGGPGPHRAPGASGFARRGADAG